ncbi:MAG: arginase family protein [Rickettsiales bacterium]|jgi:arginase family enzyme|nr:arginase family protein [Rickettsiales bacterium]
MEKLGIVSFSKMGMGLNKESSGYHMIEDLAEEISGRPVYKIWSNWPKDMDGYKEQNLHVKKYIQTLLAKYERLLVFTEDHSLVSGIFSSFGAEPFNMTYIDSHPDFNTWTSSISKLPHGMSLATLCGMEGRYFQELAGNVASLQIIGGYEIEPQEIVLLNYLGYKCEKIADFKYRGDHGNNGLSLDLDAIKDFKTCNYHVGRMRYEDIRPIISELRNSKIIEISEFNPDNGYGDYEKNIINDLLRMVITGAS